MAKKKLASGSKAIRCPWIVRSDRTVTVVRGDVFAFNERDESRPVLTMLGTTMTARVRRIVD